MSEKLVYDVTTLIERLEGINHGHGENLLGSQRLAIGEAVVRLKLQLQLEQLDKSIAALYRRHDDWFVKGRAAD